MKITTEAYDNIRGNRITRHRIDLAPGHVHLLTTQQLWQLTINALVALGKCLEKDEEEK